MRTITSHIVTNAPAPQLTITVLDEPGPGGANHQYSIRWENERDKTEPHCFIGFQNGPIEEVGVNGVTQEALLAVVLDRLQSFQAGEFPSQDNAAAIHYGKMMLNCLQRRAAAIHYGEMMLNCLQRRTVERIARGVEGTNQK